MKEPHNNTSFYTSMAVHEDLIFIGGAGGVSIYDFSFLLQRKQNCVGCMYSISETKDIVLNHIKLPNTEVKGQVLGVLHPPCDEGKIEGSLGLYQIR